MLSIVFFFFPFCLHARNDDAVRTLSILFCAKHDGHWYQHCDDILHKLKCFIEMFTDGVKFIEATAELDAKAKKKGKKKGSKPEPEPEPESESGSRSQSEADSSLAEKVEQDMLATAVGAESLKSQEETKVLQEMLRKQRALVQQQLGAIQAQQKKIKALREQVELLQESSSANPQLSQI